MKITSACGNFADQRMPVPSRASLDLRGPRSCLSRLSASSLVPARQETDTPWRNRVGELSRRRDQQAEDPRLVLAGSPNGVRTRVSTLRGWCPRPLDDGTEEERIPARSIGEGVPAPPRG